MSFCACCSLCCGKIVQPPLALPCCCTYIQNCIGNPTQTPGTNPNTTTQPGSASTHPSFLSGLTGIALKSFTGIATQAQVSAQQKIAQATGTRCVTGTLLNSGTLILVAIVGLVLFMMLRK